MLGEDIIAELGHLPKTLSDLYDLTYQRITNAGPSSRAVAERALKWLLCANRTLQTSEFIAAVSVDSAGHSVTISTNDVLSICCNMVVLDPELNIYRFAHLSVREYLESRHDYSSVKLNELAMERCLDTYISKTDENPSSTLVVALNHTLRPYAVLYWPVHLSNSGGDHGDNVSVSVTQKAKQFLFPNDIVDPCFKLWSSDAVKLGSSLKREDPLKQKLRAALLPATPLFLGSTFGWVFIIEHLIKLGFDDWDQRNEAGSSGLHIASGYGHASVVRLMLENGVRASSRGPYGKTALHKAATYGHDTIVSLLLANRADIEAKDHDGTTALHQAASNGHVAVTQTLLENGAQVEAKGSYGKTALYIAVQNAHEAVVRLLLLKNADANMQSSDGNTALHSAARAGHEGIARLLLDKGADVDVKDPNGKTALDVAAWGNHEAVIRLLLEYGADVEAKGKYGESALYRAVWGGHEPTVRLLLQHGANVGAKSSNGETVLYRAIYDGREEIVRLLLEHATANVVESWSALLLKSAPEGRIVSEEISNRVKLHGLDQKVYGPDDFQSILRLSGKGRRPWTSPTVMSSGADLRTGTYGQVYKVKKKDSQRIYAMKVLSKKTLVKQGKVARILGERNILVRTAVSECPFIVGLKFSFQTHRDLYLVTDYLAGGELFWQLQKEGRFSPERTRFYIAEIILALQHLHQHNIIFKDLRPEKILLDEDGHIALCDFGQSEAGLKPQQETLDELNEYIAPELLVDQPSYTKTVDFWSLGVLMFEMICGRSLFYAEDNEQMRRNITHGKVSFPESIGDVEVKDFMEGLLNRNPLYRLGSSNGAEELKSHPFLADCDWVSLGKKKADPPLKPSQRDVLDEIPLQRNALDGIPVRRYALDGIPFTATPEYNTDSTPKYNTDSTPGWSISLSPTMEANFKGFTFVDETGMDEHFKELHDADRNHGSHADFTLFDNIR